MAELRPTDYVLRVHSIPPALYDALAEIYKGRIVADIIHGYPFMVGITLDADLMVSGILPYVADRQDFISQYTDQLAILLGKNPLPEWFASGFGYGFPITSESFATMFIQWALYVCVEFAVSFN